MTYSVLNRAVHAIAATRPGSWLFARVLRRLDRLALRLTGERSTLTSALAGLPIVIVDTIGAKSGLVRRIPLVGLNDPAHPGVVVVIASNFGQKHHPAWLANLRATPTVRVQVQGKATLYRARELDGAAYARLWALAVAVYPGFARYKITAGARHIPLLALEPVDTT
jgi:deazaflavin-dependent oxidoreductase (nitroreductase family)